MALSVLTVTIDIVLTVHLSMSVRCFFHAVRMLVRRVVLVLCLLSTVKSIVVAEVLKALQPFEDVSGSVLRSLEETAAIPRLQRWI